MNSYTLLQCDFFFWTLKIFCHEFVMEGLKSSVYAWFRVCKKSSSLFLASIEKPCIYLVLKVIQGSFMTKIHNL